MLTLSPPPLFPLFRILLSPYSFLHHEELYHSTPETQTDESYTHPEDLEHFAHHEHIEAVEDSRAQAFLEAETETHADLPHEAPNPPPGRAAKGQFMNSNTNKNPIANNARGTSKLSAAEKQEEEKKKNETTAQKEAPSRKAPPSVAARMEGVKKVAQEDLPYGEGEAGFARPRTEREKLRRGTPYKYKFRRGRKQF
jgi:hypothetical protein